MSLAQQATACLLGRNQLEIAVFELHIANRAMGAQWPNDFPLA